MIRLALLCVSLIFVASAAGAELQMFWSGHVDDGTRTLDMSVGDTALIEVWIELNSGDTLSGVFYSNEAASELEQTAVTASLEDWTGAGVDGQLGDSQQFSVFCAEDGIVASSGKYLLGTQEIKLNSGDVGSEIDVAFQTGSSLGVLDEEGADYSLVASSSDLKDSNGYFHLGAGSPGYTASRLTDERDTLVVRIVDAGGGSGGGGSTGTGGTTDDTLDTDEDGVPDVSDDFPSDPSETTDTDDDGIGDNADNDDDGDGVVDSEDPTPLGEDDSGSSTTPTTSSPCGAGATTATTLVFFGLSMFRLLPLCRSRRQSW